MDELLHRFLRFSISEDDDSNLLRSSWLQVPQKFKILRYRRRIFTNLAFWHQSLRERTQRRILIFQVFDPVVKLLGVLVISPSSCQPVQTVAGRTLRHWVAVAGSASRLSIHDIRHIPTNSIAKIALFILQTHSVERIMFQWLLVDSVQILSILHSISNHQRSDEYLWMKKQRSHFQVTQCNIYNQNMPRTSQKRCQNRHHRHPRPDSTCHRRFPRAIDRSLLRDILLHICQNHVYDNEENRVRCISNFLISSSKFPWPSVVYRCSAFKDAIFFSKLLSFRWGHCMTPYFLHNFFKAVVHIPNFLATLN